MTIYDLPAIVKSVLPLAATPSNIQAGFACTGIWPFNRHIFSDIDFAPSQVTDRPPPEPSTSAAPTPTPPLLYSQPPLLNSQPPLLYSQPPLLHSQPPLLYSQHPLLSGHVWSLGHHPLQRLSHPLVHIQKLDQGSRPQRGEKEEKPLSSQTILRKINSRLKQRKEV
ncbi:hypothetical protein F7725_029139 [Dissostichus mawsoni]|uniref:Uncharacterized protein n=1 Tax=Dissostichus mawsoni TaxID=36200 RepID=A0A7J5XI30_DISMA|nr:hypothetical protein F7725_029139 [Dissostichus mawsoni]